MHGQYHALDVVVEGFVVLLLGDRPEGQKRAAAGVGEDGVEAALFLLDLGIEAIQISRFGYVGLHAFDVASDLLYRRV